MGVACKRRMIVWNPNTVVVYHLSTRRQQVYIDEDASIGYHICFNVHWTFLSSSIYHTFVACQCQSWLSNIIVVVDRCTFIDQYCFHPNMASTDGLHQVPQPRNPEGFLQKSDIHPSRPQGGLSFCVWFLAPAGLHCFPDSIMFPIPYTGLLCGLVQDSDS